MCGIAGIASDWLSVGDISVFKDLMHLNVLRGWRGSGVAVVTTGKKPKVIVEKTEDTGTHLIIGSQFNNMIKSLGQKSIILGHTRQPTKGADKLDNVHPHQFGHIIGVHNGTLKRVKGDWIWGTDLSDSHQFYKDVAERGITEAITQVEGAYTLVWIDMKEMSLNFLRNEERPLFLAREKGNNPHTLWWASQENQLQMVLEGRNDVEIRELKPDVHSKYRLPMKKATPFFIQELKPDPESYKKVQSWSQNNKWDKDKDKEKRSFIEDWEGEAYGEVVPFVHGHGATSYGGGLTPSEILRRREALQLDQEHPDPKGNVNVVNAANLNGPSVPSLPFYRAGVNQTLVGSDKQVSLRQQLQNAKGRPVGPPQVPKAAPYKNERVEHVFETNPGYYVTGITLTEYLRSGCCFCGRPSNMSEYDKSQVIWYNYKEFICEPCMVNTDAGHRQEMADMLPKFKTKFLNS